MPVKKVRKYLTVISQCTYVGVEEHIKEDNSGRLPKPLKN